MMLYYLADNEQDGNRLVQKLNKLLKVTNYTSVNTAALAVEHHALVRFERKYLTLLDPTEQSKVLDTVPNSFR